MSTSAPSVLIVDDEPGILAIAQANLEGQGFRVRCAATGAAALREVKVARPDLVVLDLMLPDIEGWEVLRRLEADPETAGTPVILLTALAADADVLRGLEQGAVEYITKPFYPEDLVASVKINLQVFDSTLRDGRRQELIARRRRLIDMRAHLKATAESRGAGGAREEEGP